MKNSFVLYTKYGKQINMLDMEQRGVLLTAIFAYETNEEMPEMDAITELAFAFIKSDLDENNVKYEERCKRNAENGARGGRPKKQTVSEAEVENQENPKNPLGIPETQKNPKNPLGISKTQEKPTKPKKPDNDNDNDIERNSILKNTAKKEQKPKHKHGEYGHVLLTDEETKKLKADFGDVRTEEAIRFLDEYIGEKGYKSKSHYLAMRRWVFDALDDLDAKRSRNGRSAPSQQNTARAPTAQNRFNNFEQRNYDYGELERQLLNRKGGG